MKRFEVRHVEEDSCWVLHDTQEDKEVFHDNMEPEDALLVRDLAPLVDLLNKQAEDIRTLQFVVRSLQGALERGNEGSRDPVPFYRPDHYQEGHHCPQCGKHFCRCT